MSEQKLSYVEEKQANRDRHVTKAKRIRAELEAGARPDETDDPALAWDILAWVLKIGPT